jgi:hypothetical protein
VVRIRSRLTIMLLAPAAGFAVAASHSAIMPL